MSGPETPPDRLRLRDLIEPSAHFPGFPKTDRDTAWDLELQASQAISLKRIADCLSVGSGAFDKFEKLIAVLDPENPDGFLRASINCYGEGIGEAIQGQMVRGQRGIDQYEGR